jgi:hypothetical protein
LIEASSNSASGQNKTEEHSKVKTEAYQMGHVWNVLKDPVLFHNEYGALDHSHDETPKEFGRKGPNGNKASYRSGSNNGSGHPKELSKH